MAGSEGERLRQLVSDYYHGLISAGSYREQRAELLDNIGVPMDVHTDTITRRKKKTAANDSAASQSAPPSHGSPASTSGTKKVVTIAVAIAGIVAVAYLIATERFEIGAGPTPGAEDEAIGPESGVVRGDALIEEFLSRNDWSADSQSNFLLAWGALDDGHRQLTTEGRRYRRFATMLHQRIREEIALGNAKSRGRLDSLMDFAVTMGAPYRGSSAPDVDESPPPKAVVSIDRQAETLDADTSVADPETVPTEDPEEEPESVAAETLPADDTDQPAEETGQPSGDAELEIDAVTRDLDAEPLATTSPGIAGDDRCPAGIANTRRPYCQDVLPDGSKGPPLVVLQTGSFEMGDDAVDSESPAHVVEIAQNIAMSRFEITAEEYAAFCTATSLPCPDQPWQEDHPVVSVSWDDAVSYTEWLSESTGFSYRLPSEAEWEFAARAGTRSPYFFGDEITPSAALSSVNSPVDAPLPRTDRTINRNPFRLYHMSGNVREWTMDAWYPNYESAGRDGSARLQETEVSRVVRGGSYSDQAGKLRSAAREPLERSHHDTMTGFRVVRDVLPASR